MMARRKEEPTNWSGFFREVERSLNNGIPTALATIVEASGSTPQKPGAMMAVCANGQTIGTVGGGCVEGTVKSACLEALLRSGGACVIDVSLTDDIGAEEGDVCGGSMRILIEPLV